MICDHKFNTFLFSFKYDAELVLAIKALPERRYDKDKKIWTVPDSHKQDVLKFGSHYDFTFTTAAKQAIENKSRNDKSQQEVRVDELKLKTLEAITPKLPDLSTIDVDVSIPGNERFDKLFSHQISMVKWAFWARKCIIADEMGLGKVIADDTPVLTPNGWKNHGDLFPGDYVIGSNGMPTKVLEVFRNPMKDYYKITFTDGSTAESCDEHLWAVQSTDHRYRGGKFLVKTLREIMNNLKMDNGNLNWYIPMVKPVSFNYKNVSIDPYVLGCLLGDGSIAHGSVVITNTDDELLYKLEGRLPPKIRLKRRSDKISYGLSKYPESSKNNIITNSLRSYGLMGKKSEKKFIPKDYKYNSFDIRIEMLRGILDTDGFVGKDGTIQHYSVSKMLSDDVKELVQSFGGVARQSSKIGKYKDKKGDIVVCQKCYILTINMPQEIIPFSISRKVNRLNKNKKYIPTRGIKKVEFSRKAFGQCIRVEAKDSLYVIDQYVVTHNTMSALVAARNIGKPIIVVCPASLIDNWTREAGYAGVELSGVWSYGKMPEEYPEPYTLIADEAHAFQNTSSIRGKRFLKLAKKADAVFAVTGTPIKNGRPINLMPLLIACEHETIKDLSYYQIHYCNARKTPWSRWDCNGSRNLTELHARTKDVMFRRRKEECLDLPEKIRQKVQVEMTDKTKYNQEIEALIEQFNVEVPDPMAMSRQQAIGFMMKARRLSSIQKVGGACEIIDEILEEGGKVVVFTAFVDSAKMLAEKYKDKSLLLIGETNVSIRQSLVDKFQTDPAKRVFVATFGAGGVGITLTAATNVVLVDRTFVPADADQAESRCHRISTTGTVLCSWLQLDELDEKIDKIIESKEENIELVLDGKRKTVNKNSAESIALAFMPMIFNKRRKE